MTPDEWEAKMDQLLSDHDNALVETINAEEALQHAKRRLERANTAEAEAKQALRRAITLLIQRKP